MLLSLLGLGLGIPGRAVAQEPSAPPPALPPSASAPAARTAHEAELEQRLRQMEDLLKRMPDPEHVRRLESTVQELSNQVDQLSTRLRQSEAAARRTPSLNGTRVGPGGAGTAAGGGMSGSPTGGPLGGGVGPDGAGAGEVVEIGPLGGAAAVGPSAELPSARFDMPEPIPNIPAIARFGPGFQIRTLDHEFDIQFHDLTEIDGRFYGIRTQTPVADSFTIPRQWFIFSGHMTRPYEYYLSIAEAFDGFNILDVFLNVNYDRRLQFRIGRFKSPFTYEFWGTPAQGLPNGEWSLFFNNFGINRDLGAMFWGESAAGRIDYAAGIFNGTPNGQLDLSTPKSLIAYLNIAPFRPASDSVLENFNIGGSVVAGDQDHIPIPQTLRTIVPTAGNTALGVPFLAFNNNVVVNGPRDLWSLHAAYYYGGLTLYGEWQSGFVDYGLANQADHRVHLPIESFYVQAAYLLTGERVASRGMVKPRRPFDLRRGRFGLGAWEVAFRYSELGLGHQVFTAGLADPTLWTDHLFTTDVGISWYWNEHVCVLFDWQHAGFGTPVLYRPGGFAGTSDLFLIRFQLWF
jgi:phosphate-selective porin OprO/OprP